MPSANSKDSLEKIIVEALPDSFKEAVGKYRQAKYLYEQLSTKPYDPQLLGLLQKIYSEHLGKDNIIGIKNLEEVDIEGKVKIADTYFQFSAQKLAKEIKPEIAYKVMDSILEKGEKEKIIPLLLNYIQPTGITAAAQLHKSLSQKYAILERAIQSRDFSEIGAWLQNKYVELIKEGKEGAALALIALQHAKNKELWLNVFQAYMDAELRQFFKAFSKKKEDKEEFDEKKFAEYIKESLKGQEDNIIKLVLMISGMKQEDIQQIYQIKSQIEK